MKGKCKKCGLRCCLNCKHFAGAREEERDHLIDLKCRVHAREQAILGDQSYAECSRHDYGYGNVLHHTDPSLAG